jgi:hypothetical protein
MTPIAKDDTAVHTAELKEWKESAIGNGALPIREF